MGERSRTGTNTGVTGRDYLRGLFAVGGFVVMACGVALWLLSAMSTCACAEPATVVVRNLSPADGTFAWRSSGVLGTPILGDASSEPIAACSDYAHHLDPGTHRLTITTVAGARDFDLTVPWESRTDTLLWLVIRPDGSVAESTAADRAATTAPSCGP